MHDNVFRSADYARAARGGRPSDKKPAANGTPSSGQQMSGSESVSTQQNASAPKSFPQQGDSLPPAGSGDVYGNGKPYPGQREIFDDYECD